MLRINIKNMKMYEEDTAGSSSGVLKISSSALKTASENYSNRAKEILMKLTGSETFTGDSVEGVSGGIAGKIKTMIDNGYWNDANGQKYLQAANSVLDDILKLIPKEVSQITFKKLQLGEKQNDVYEYVL